uniref:Exonuclease V, mitochondrial n=1 Tax=Blastobotrys adeninivorans TaxID=409370 RepID=A0A060T6V7_BLAAD
MLRVRGVSHHCGRLGRGIRGVATIQGPVQDHIDPRVKNYVSTDNSYLPHRLDKVSPMALFRPQKFSVTDLTTQYCELRSFYQFIMSEPPIDTRRMEEGTRIHKELEDAAKVSVQVPEEAVHTPEDAWAAKFLTNIDTIGQFHQNGMTRELYVFGTLRGHLVTGYIDLVEMTADKRCRIVDTKTRKSHSLPVESQQASAFHQLLLYHELFDQLRGDPIDMKVLADRMGIDPQRPISQMLLDTFGKPAQSLQSVYQDLNQAFSTLPPPSSNLRVDYMTNVGRGVHRHVTTLASIEYQFDPAVLDELIEFSLAFWQGQRNPLGVQAHELTKCEWCPMAPKCKWRESLES